MKAGECPVQETGAAGRSSQCFCPISMGLAFQCVTKPIKLSDPSYGLCLATSLMQNGSVTFSVKWDYYLPDLPSRVETSERTLSMSTCR